MEATNKESGKSCLLQLIAIPISGYIFYLIMKYLIDWVPNLADLLAYVKEPLKNSDAYKGIAVGIAVVVAILLIKLKEKLIVAFGLLEVVGGGWTLWTTFGQNFENALLYALAIGGAIFLMINGFENIQRQQLQDYKLKKKVN